MNTTLQYKRLLHEKERELMKMGTELRSRVMAEIDLIKGIKMRKQKVWTDLIELIQYSAEYQDKTDELPCEITLTEEGKVYKAYSVNISHRELGFYCDKGYISYWVDGYPSGNFLILNDIEESEE